MKKDLLGPEEVAEYLGVGLVTIYRWCREGRLPCLKIGKHWRIHQKDLQDFLRHNQPPVAAPSEELCSFLNTLSAHTAIIDGSGTIVTVNEPWRIFAISNGAILPKVMEGANYFRVCDSAKGDQSEYAATFADGIRSVFAGQREGFEMEYPCHSPAEERWFVGRVLPFRNGSSPQAVVMHENVTERKQMEQQLKDLAERLEALGMNLQDLTQSAE
jgi:excisionase family DNA binding protein